MFSLLQWINDTAVEWLIKETDPPPTPLCDFKRLQFEVRTGDVILIEGRSRISEVIKVVTQSPWSHSALYIGKIYDITDPILREEVKAHYKGDPENQLILEALIGKGTIISPMNDYQDDHVRICRPDGISPDDIQKVTAYALKHLGWDYDFRQILDLGRFFFPWHFLPRRWRSSLFQHNIGAPTRIVCSTLIAEAFNSVDFPILPFIDRDEDGSLRFFKRNPRLFAPRDFDYSPYFNIVKYPFIGVNDRGLYHRLPWVDEDVLYNDELHDFNPSAKSEGTEDKKKLDRIEETINHSSEK